RVVATEVGVIGFVAVGAPVAFEFAGIRVKHGHAFVEVSVGDIGFIGLWVNKDFGHFPEVLRVVAAAVFAQVAELREEAAVLSELQNVGVVRAVAADPDVAFVINGDAVVRLRPFVALSGAAPAPDQVAGLIELEYGWGLRAAVAGLLIRRRLVRRERVL